METIKNWWTNFTQKHKLVAQFVKFYAFSLFVTVLQYLLLTFLPGLFYNLTDWCSIPCQLIHLNLGPVDTYVFNYPVTGDATGGMGYFAAFAITLFLAQCVNFPMQRNITFKSKGNVWYQIAWYVVAFVLITIVCSFLMGLYVPLCKQFFSGLPTPLIESAKIDGAGHWRIMTKIVFPMVVPGMTSIAIYGFVWSWNDLLYSMTLVTDTAKRTLASGLVMTFLGEASTN